MSRKSSTAIHKIETQAHIFAALGDPTRLTLVSKLIDGKSHSISALADGKRITRQAITKHLRVLENVGLVSKLKEGRESLYELSPEPLESLQEFLDIIASSRDRTLNDLKKFVED